MFRLAALAAIGISSVLSASGQSSDIAPKDRAPQVKLVQTLETKPYGIMRLKEALAAAPLSILGDTNHYQRLDRFLLSDEVLDAMQDTGKKYIGLEDNVSAQGAIDQLSAGKITLDTFVDLRLAQEKARGERATSGDTKGEIVTEGILALKARARGMALIVFDTMEGEDGPARKYQKARIADYKEYRQQGGTNSLKDFKDPRDSDLIGALNDDILDSRMSLVLNRHIYAAMSKAVKVKQKSADTVSESQEGRLPAMVMFSGSGHALSLQKAAARKGIESSTTYIFANEAEVEIYDDDLLGEKPSMQAKEFQLPNVNYLVLDTGRWHAANTPETLETTPVVVHETIPLLTLPSLQSPD